VIVNGNSATSESKAKLQNLFDLIEAQSTTFKQRLGPSSLAAPNVLPSMVPPPALVLLHLLLVLLLVLAFSWTLLPPSSASSCKDSQ
jgi:hypothetical protein